MTIDKIKHYMNPDIFAHWSNCRDAAIIEKAKNTLESELQAGLLDGIQYHAELNFLKLLLG